MSSICRECFRDMPKNRKGYEQVCYECGFKSFLINEHIVWNKIHGLNWKYEHWIKGNKPSHWIELAAKWREEGL